MLTLYAKFDGILLATFKVTVKSFWLTFFVDKVYMFIIQQLQLSVKPGEGFNPRNYGYSIWRRCNHRTATTNCRTVFFRIYYSPIRELAKRKWGDRYQVAEMHWDGNTVGVLETEWPGKRSPSPIRLEVWEHTCTQQVLSRQILKWKRNFIDPKVSKITQLYRL